MGAGPFNVDYRWRRQVQKKSHKRHKPTLKGAFSKNGIFVQLVLAGVGGKHFMLVSRGGFRSAWLMTQEKKYCEICIYQPMRVTAVTGY